MRFEIGDEVIIINPGYYKGTVIGIMQGKPAVITEASSVLLTNETAEKYCINKIYVGKPYWRICPDRLVHFCLRKKKQYEQNI